MDVRIKWVDGMMFLGESESGHAIVIDGPPEIGGNNMGWLIASIILGILFGGIM